MSQPQQQRAERLLRQSAGCASVVKENVDGRRLWVAYDGKGPAGLNCDSLVEAVEHAFSDEAIKMNEDRLPYSTAIGVVEAWKETLSESARQHLSDNDWQALLHSMAR